MKTEFKVNGIHCPSCMNLIKMNIEELDGIKSIKTNEKNKTVEVDFDEKFAKTEKIIEKIQQEGYKVVKFTKRAK